MAGLWVLAARRLTLLAASSGVAFSTVRAGAWGNGKDSRELLSNLRKSTQESLQTLRQGSAPSSMKLLSERMRGAHSVRERLARTWNHAVQSTCLTLSGQSETYHKMATWVNDTSSSGWRQLRKSVTDARLSGNQ